ncbi:MAG: DUF721 domain-containing protein [Desulfosarcinaceae bacterium]|nr:DUF721 domain-containing protein [Desulfosarcinaceae bacterium]
MPTKRTPMKRPIPLGDVIHELLHRHRPTSADRLARVCDIWPLAVGDSIARNAKPGAIQGKVLVVHVTNSTWLHQLRFMKTDMLVKLNQHLGTAHISDLRFKIGAL